MELRPGLRPVSAETCTVPGTAGRNRKRNSKLCQPHQERSQEGFRPDAIPRRSPTDVHRSAYAAMGVRDAYIGLKIRSDEIAERYLSLAEAEVVSSDDPLRAALAVAALGNIMDFGSGIAIDDPNEFKDLFEKLMSQGICTDEEALAAIRDAGSVLYIFDNCGESQMDKALIRLLRRMGKKVTGVVRGEPILNDVTMEDAKRSGLDKELDSILTTGVFAVGVDMRKAPKDLKDAINSTDLILSKAWPIMSPCLRGNWETGGLCAEDQMRPRGGIHRADPEKNVVRLFRSRGG